MISLVVGIALAAAPEGQLVVTYFSDSNNCREGNIGNVTTLLNNQCIQDGSRYYRATCVNGNAVRFDCGTAACEQCTEQVYATASRGQCQRSGGGRAQPRGYVVDFTCPLVQATSNSAVTTTTTATGTQATSITSPVQGTTTTITSGYTTSTARGTPIATTNAATLSETGLATYLGTLISLLL
jgi:hypothetical protein